MLRNILGQPASLLALLGGHAGDGFALAAAAKLVRAARGTVYFTGMGASLFAALPAVDRLRQRGVRVVATESSELLHYGAPALRREDVGVLISRSGGSVEVLRLAEKMRAAGMATLGVSNVRATQLEALVDLTLPIGSEPDQLIAVQTYTGTLAALLLLAEKTQGSDRWGALCAASLPALAAWIERCREASASWQAFLDVRQPLYLLGRGPALAAAHEGALLLHEAAKAPAVALSSGQFRHGPVEVVADGFRAIVLGSPQLTREVECSLAEDLMRMRADVRWLGPLGRHASAPSGVVPLAPWPEVDAALAPLFEIVPLQLAAYRLALWRGVAPGDFRFASEVTASESGFPLWEARLAKA